MPATITARTVRPGVTSDDAMPVRKIERAAAPISDPTERRSLALGLMDRSRVSPATILVVESEAIVRLELVDWLTGEGLDALAAANADEAVAHLDSHPEIEIMMTDIDMTGSMDGIRLAHHVRDRWPPIRIVVVSGRPPMDREELPSGVFFIPKPIEREGLLVQLRGLLAA